jgi:hypothetical protein
MVLKDTLVTATRIDPYVAGDNIGFGVALIRTAAGVCKGSMADNAANLIGFSIQPQNGVTLDKDGLYQLVNNSSLPDVVRVARRGSIIRALCIAKANTSIVDGDFMEAAPLGDASCYIGVLNEAGADEGETKIAGACFQAWESKTMTNASYKQPSVNVVVGDSTVTLVAGDVTLLDLSEGDYIVLEDVNGDAQLNRVKSKTTTVITLQWPSTVALTANTDYVYKCFQILGQII